jgi:hypothetical protein
MQTTVWLAALFFTQNAYTTTWGSVRQAGLVNAEPSVIAGCGALGSPTHAQLKIFVAQTPAASNFQRCSELMAVYQMKSDRLISS